MIDSSKLTPSQGWSLLLVGEPKSGKTNVAFDIALSYPEVHLIDADRNCLPAVRRHPGRRVFIDYVDVDENEKHIDRAAQWLRFVELRKKRLSDPQFGCFVDDSLSSIAVACQEYIISEGSTSTKDLKIGGEKVMQLSYWQPFEAFMSRYINMMKASQKPYIMVCHQKVDTDAVTGTLGYRPAIGGQLADKIAGMFSDYWKCEIKTTASGPVYFVRTMPTSRMILGNSLGLPTEFEFDQLTFKKKMMEVYGK